MTESILKVKNLSVKLNGDEIIKNLSFEVKQGEFFTILGPNGSGKTTLFRALLGLIPHPGEISWSQKNPKIAYLPERLSRLKFKELPISIREFFRFKESSDEKIFEMLKLTGLNDSKILEKSPGNLSSGQFQRLLIGWGLIGSPQVLFFDEPTSGIDVGGEETIYSLLHKIWKERNFTILLISHDLNIVYRFSTNVLCLNKKAVCFGPPREILTPENLEKLYGAEIKFYKHSHN
jgi:zinc transport system ATP-binding protein